jgi:hypothetical protein
MFLKNFVAKDHIIIIPRIVIAIGAIIATADKTLSFIAPNEFAIIVNCASMIHRPGTDNKSTKKDKD